MLRLIACLTVLAAFLAWQPVRAETEINSAICEEVTPVGGSVAPARSADWSSRAIGRAKKMRCKAKPADAIPAAPPYTEPLPASAEPALAPDSTLPDDAEPQAINPWLSPDGNEDHWQLGE